MEAQLALVRSALQALYAAHDGATRKAADTWLQNFRNSSGSWQLCLALLARPGLADYEYHFAAHSLRLACCKVPELLDPNVLQGLAVQLATLLLASVGGAAWPVAGQLSSALAALAVRAVCWEAEALVPQLLSLLTPQVAAAMLADLTMGGVGVGVEGGHGGGAPVLTAAVGAEATAVFALLQVVTGLPEACAARAVSAHPQRKAQVAAALAADATVVPLLRATVVGIRALDAAAAGGLPMHHLPVHLPMGLGVGPLGLVHGTAAAAAAGAGGGLTRATLRRAGLQLLHAWAEQLGSAPRGLEHEAELVSCLYEALATPDTATIAAECLCGLFATCSTQPRDGPDDGYASDASSSSSSMVMAEPLMPPPPTQHGGATGGHRRTNWGEAAGFRKPRQGIGGGGGGARGGGGGGGSAGRSAAGGAQHGGGGGAAAAAVAAAAAASPERQMAGMLLLQRLLDGLQALLQGAAMVYREQQQQVALLSGGRVGAAEPGVTLAGGGDGAFAFWSGWSDGTALQALCSVLCSAAAAVLPGALRGGDASLQAHFNALWPQLMALLGNSNPEVALSCVSFWQDTYLAQLMQVCAPATPHQQQQQPPGQQQHGVGQDGHQAQAQGQQQQQQAAVAGGAVVLQSHLPLLAQLLAGLVSRAALGPEAAAVATADARDLPEEVRMVRRELGATMRDLVGLVGLGHVAAFLERMIAEHAAQLGAANAAASGAGGSAAAAAAAGGGPPSSWTRLESSLYAANVALCSGGGKSDGLGAAAGPAVDDAHIASIISTAAAAVVHPASSLKLAGTALTLVGGMAGWFSEHPLELARPLESVRAALASPDEKLARNAATALNRLCVHGGCASLLLGRYGVWVSGLRALLPGPEVTLRHKPAPGVDMTSRELLVASLMRLACGGGGGAQQQPAQPPSSLTHHHHHHHHHHQQQQHQSMSRSGSKELSMSRTGSRDLDGGGSSSASSSNGSGGASLPPQLLLQQLLAPRVVAAAAELERLAATLGAVTSSGALQAHLQLWRINRQQQQQRTQQQQQQLTHHHHHQHVHAQYLQPQQQQQLQVLHQLQHCQQHCQQPCHHDHAHLHDHSHGHGVAAGVGGSGGDGGGAHRAPLCQPGAPQELQALGAAALVAAQRLGGLASMLLFVPAAGQVQDMGAGVSGGRRGNDGGGGAVTPQEAVGDGTGGAAAATSAVVALVVQVVRAVWPNLMACLRPTSAGAADGAGAAVETGAGCADGCASMLLGTYEGAHVLPAACSLLQGSLLVAASPRGNVAAGGAAGGGDGLATTAELLSCAVRLLDLSHGVQPVPPTEQQLQQQQWPANLDWPADADATGAGGAAGLHSRLHPGVRPLWQGPPVCILQLVLGCLPLCGRILAQPQQAQQQQQQQQQGTAESQVAAVAEQGVRAACLVARSACASLQVPRMGRPVGQLGGSSSGLSLDSDRVLLVLPVLQSLLLHVPQALAASRDLLECLVAATVTCMSCHDAEACRAVLDWTQLLLCTTAFAPPPQMPQAAGGRARPAVAGGRAGGGGSSGGLAALQARCSQVPALERCYAGIAALLDAPCLCCAPNTVGLVYTVAAADAAAKAPALPGAVLGPGLRRPPSLSQLAASLQFAPAAAAAVAVAAGGGAAAAGAGAAVGSLGAVLVLSLMVAAAGGMPPDLMLPISTCLHSGWMAMGGARFRAWVRAAAVDLSSPALAAAAAAASGTGGGLASPWARLKPESLAAALAELWGEECERDVMRFKRSLKALCGGKKKGGL